MHKFANAKSGSSWFSDADSLRPVEYNTYRFATGLLRYDDDDIGRMDVLHIQT